TGLADGRIVQILEDSLKTVAVIDPSGVGAAECARQAFKHTCGRPLGLRFDSRGTLYAIDPYNGLFSVDVNSGEIKLIVDAAKIGARFLDDFVLLEKANGLLIYMTDVSTRWDLHEAMFCVA